MTIALSSLCTNVQKLAKHQITVGQESAHWIQDPGMNFSCSGLTGFCTFKLGFKKEKIS
eukprot:c54199_g1_i1 orf=172-348(-)